MTTLKSCVSLLAAKLFDDKIGHNECFLSNVTIKSDRIFRRNIRMSVSQKNEGSETKSPFFSAKQEVDTFQLYHQYIHQTLNKKIISHFSDFLSFPIY